MVVNTLVTLSIVYLLAKSMVLEPYRAWLADRHRVIAELIYCNICLSFWVALLLTFNLYEALAIMGVFVIINVYETKH